MDARTETQRSLRGIIEKSLHADSAVPSEKHMSSPQADSEALIEEYICMGSRHR